MDTSEDISPADLRQRQIEKYWQGDLARKRYLVRRQRKAILENCRRIAVLGLSNDPETAGFVSMEKLLGMSLEVIPVSATLESLLGVRCFKHLLDIPGKIDIVQVFPDGVSDITQPAREAVEKEVATFWIEGDMAACEEVEAILTDGHVQLVEYESLEVEYLKHTPSLTTTPIPRRELRKAAKVKDRMTRNPATAKPGDAIKEAIWKMEHGRFRHLPVIDERGKLIGMLSDRDVRLIRPALAFESKEDAMVQLWSISVQQAAVFDPVRVTPETTLRETAELMLRWHVGGLPVVDHGDTLVGIITYTDLLREFVGRKHEGTNHTHV